MGVKNIHQSKKLKMPTVQFKIFMETTAFHFSWNNTWSEDLYFVVSAMLFTFHGCGKDERIVHMSSIFKTAEPQKCDHMITDWNQGSVKWAEKSPVPDIV